MILMIGTEDISPPIVDWAGPDGALSAYITETSKNTLHAYRHQPNLVDEHANHEEDTARGGYAHRQLFELIQNSADALVGASADGRIAIRLTEACLYCADNGKAIDRDGVKALMFSHLSPKRGTSEIGRFGVGFKSVLGVTDAPEFFCRSGSFRFDRDRSRKRILQVAPDAGRYPVLRLPDPIDPCESRDKDDVLRELMGWATNIVRLPLKPDAYKDLDRQVRGFLPEFLLFVEHVHQLMLNSEVSELDRTLEMENVNGEYLLADGDKIGSWRLFKRTHQLSEKAKADRRSLDDGDEVPIWWAAPIDRLTDPGQFWAFFPTKTASLVAGILNAPWKTNEDRQNLLSGPYNDELIKSAAEMIADELPKLATQSDPARYLDALPRRRESGDSEQVDLLREQLFSNLFGRKIVPDQNGSLRTAQEIRYPPKELTSDGQVDLTPFERWAACPNRPSGWLNHKALTRNRLAVIDRLFPQQRPGQRTAAPRATIVEWLEALVEDRGPDEVIHASMAAIQAAATIPPERLEYYADIVLTATGDLRDTDPDAVFLPDETQDGGHDPSLFVHPELASDRDTLAALKKLGIKPLSPEISFKRIVDKVFYDSYANPSKAPWTEFWEQARKVRASAQGIIRERSGWRPALRVRTRSGCWRPIHCVLLPGEIVPGDGNRDDDATVDTDFHEPDLELLRNLGMTEKPLDSHDPPLEPWFSSFKSDCRQQFTRRTLPRNPHLYHLKFASIERGSGPLEVLTALSDEGRALYTDVLLSLDATYKKWKMVHDTQSIYPPLWCGSPAIYMLRKYGRIRTSNSIVPFADALGRRPNNLAALYALLAHAKSDRIKEAFDLADPTPEFTAIEDPIYLTVIWPGLRKYLPEDKKTCRLIPCESILLCGAVRECVLHASDIYLTRTGEDDKARELRLVSEALELDLDEKQLEDILQLEARRAKVSEYPTDAERLLTAVGEQALRQGLSYSLLEILENESGELSGVEVAKAAIATYHSDALKEYKLALDHLDPPPRWGGSAQAVAFVRSLGFSAEWAGERNRRPSPYLEVDGPYSLPPLHNYQEKIVAKVRDMLRNGHVDGAQRRGMISMPTGSGKTRVAVQAIIEAMQEDGFDGDILWVADREELCEQAVEALRQAWSNIGARGVQLLISRMWAEQPKPQTTSDPHPHVVVATIQTLNARLSSRPDEYEFLADFKLVVFDEAHRSIAPSFTSVMREIGLTRRQRSDEPFLLGLTATPYRGYNEEETTWLVNRYGSNRLDAGAFKSDDPQHVVGELQYMRVLAQADHETIEGGAYSVNDHERQQMGSLPWLPRSVEDRIAEDHDRTRRIVEAYEAHIKPDWPTLIFATSVEHAQTVAAFLNLKGVKSRAVSGNTNTLTRRRVVEEFRRGEIKALVNYGVFREGFDAPKTRAIIVARPVYSPNLYFQMIGRGLRGVKNGGNDRCLILNVRDNIQNFQRALAFSDLDWLWA